MAAMGASHSSPLHTEGTVDGEAATFFYKKSDNASDAKFSWTSGHKVHPESKWNHIAAKDIIAVAAPRGTLNTEVYHLMYLQDNATKSDENHKESPKILRSLELSKPPSALVHDFSPCAPPAVCLDLRCDPGEVQPNFHVVVSIGSGTGLAEAFWEQVPKPVLGHAGLVEDKDYIVHVTKSESSITELTKDVILPQANMGVAQSIILLSGDGGLLDIVNGLLAGERSAQYKKPNIALLALGTGNALAHSTGIMDDNTLGVRTCMRGAVRHLPLFKVTFSPGARYLVNEGRDEQQLHLDRGVPTAYGAVVCSWGLHAGLVADSDTAEYRKFGNERFKMAAKEALFPSDGSMPHPYKGSVSILQRSPNGSEKWQAIEREDHGYVLATPLSTLEPGFTISPASRPLDGILRLIHFGPMSGEEAMGMMGGAYQGGKHVEDERVGYEVIDGMRIEFHEEEPRWRRVCIDGKIVRVEAGGWVELRPYPSDVVDIIAQ